MNSHIPPSAEVGWNYAHLMWAFKSMGLEVCEENRPRSLTKMFCKLGPFLEEMIPFFY